ncbi:hypothetical protein QBC34DRAFT_454864 [Podospora aff. communis PSN243]|uniref:Uncharacterized protein n=1 Tax=Podospora aff. communis PSN243 TaxID=3040156 RepID=A0AAV9G5K5_9PEZI|nr:hypothetical protein QBC34DRAFT_454864 [Podospora aff. communis PSN243]
MASRPREANVATGDAGPGTGLKDLLPTPATNPTDPTQTEDKSLSHALATDDHSEKGHAQLDHEEEVQDLGWNEKKEDIAAPLVGGMDNEELWLLLRRFDKQIYHLKAVQYPVPGGLDLNIADEDEFSPDKLRANLERLYMTIGVGILAAVKHIARLRSWRETKRTSWFAAAYFVAWLFDFIVPLLLSVLVALIVYPKSREFLFPPAPMSLVDSKTGGVQKPKSGVLGSHDSATGAPENHKGEAVEQEASNFVNGIAAVALSSAAGKHPQGDPDSEDEESTAAAPDPTAIAMGAAQAKDKAGGSKPGAKHDKTKVPMETALWTKMRPLMHMLGDMTDNWERVANALSPTPPFPRETHRMRLAGVIVPILGVSLFVTSYMFTKAMTFAIGFGFFGDPLISRGLDWLNRTIPNWQKLLELRNTLLKGMPTNAQLTITLLRIGEANHAPLPPPPRVGSPPPSKPASLTDDSLRATGSEPPLNATPAELDAAISHDASTKHQAPSDVAAAKSTSHGKKGSKLLNFFRGTTAGAVHTAIGTDTVRAAAGSKHARDRKGVIPPPNSVPVSGPVEFEARYDGKKGHVYLSTAASVPVVAFGAKETQMEIGGKTREDLHPVWSVAVGEIVEVKKIGGYGWKAKLVVGWSLDREVKDGLEIVTGEGRRFKITAVPLRDELFNRLVAMGGQKWEAW